jgi:uncharacterized protein YjiS (DUF1127 family)
MKGGASRTRVVPVGAKNVHFHARAMTNHHGRGLLKQVSDTLHIWRDRVRQRRELAQWTDRDLHDVGLSWSDIALEVKKPFWRA